MVVLQGACQAATAEVANANILPICANGLALKNRYAPIAYKCIVIVMDHDRI